MKFDLSKEIQLVGKSFKIYRVLRWGVYFLALVVFFGVSFMVLFPSYDFFFDFSTPDSKKNSITNLQDTEGSFISQGKMVAQEVGSFNVSLAGAFSKIKIVFGLNKKNLDFESGKINVKKGFAVLFSEQGLPRGFNDGNLLKYGEDYFIVSDKNLRQFDSLKLMESLGFKKEMFQEVSQDDLKFGFVGKKFIGLEKYPNKTLFSVNGEYYSFNGGKLDKFLSEQAYLSRYSEEQAIVKDETLFKKHGNSKNIIGFADGTLVAYGESAYFIEGEMIMPIDSADTFQALGFDWNDLIQISGDEFSFYEKGDLVKIDALHPNNTVFKIQENGQFYIYENGALHLLSSEKAAQSWSKRKPVMISEKSFTKTATCDLKKSGIIFPHYYCVAEINQLEEIPGKDYQVDFSFSKDVNIDTIETTLSKNLTWKNIRFSIGEILRKIKLNYVKEN